jgi:protein-disulfide isomerase
LTWPTRRAAVLGLAVLAPLARAQAAGSAAKPKPAPEEGMALGNPRAKVTVVEYASLSCPHCAHWANDVFPAFKARFIDTGKVRYVLREFITEPADVAAAGWLLARCAGPSKYFDVVAAVFRDQQKMYDSQDIRGTFLAIAKGAGLSEAQFDQCLKDTQALDALNKRVDRYASEDKIDSTPTFVVNGTVLKGGQTLDQLAAAIAQAQHPRGKKR